MITLRDGHWYRSKRALASIAGLACADGPHLTPDGFAVLVCDLGGRTMQPAVDGPAGFVLAPPRLVVQAGHGHDLMHMVRDEQGQLAIRRVEFPIDALDDLEPLVEYDHLPESRKDYTVYPRGHKLA